MSPQRFAGGPRQEQRRRQWRLSQSCPDRRNQAALWTVTSTARITPSSPASPRAGRHLHRLGPRPPVANDRLRHRLIVQHGCACYDWSAILSPCSWAFHWAITQTRSHPSYLPAVAFYFVRHQFARRYLLRVDGDGRVRVTIPRGGSRREATAFGLRHLNWIAGQRARIQRPGLTADERRGLQARANVELPARLRDLAAMHGLAVSRVTVRNQRTRWGSCGRNGHITLKWSKHPDVGTSAASKAVDNRAKRCLDELEQGSDQGLARSSVRVNPDVGTAG